MICELRDDNDNQLIDLTSLTGTYYPHLATPLISSRANGRNEIALTLVSAENDPNIRMHAIERLSRVLAEAAAYANDQYGGANDYVWLYLSDSNEYQRRALVYGGDLAGRGNRWANGMEQTGRGGHSIDCVITIGPWESITVATITLSGVAVDTAEQLDPLGSMPGRVAEIRVTPTSANGLTTFALGMRPTYRGKTDFDPNLHKSSGTSQTYTQGADEGTEKEIWNAALSSLSGASDYTHTQGRYRVYMFALGINVSDYSLRVALGDSAGNIGPAPIYDSGPYIGTLNIPPSGKRAALSSANIGSVVVYVYGTAYTIDAASGTISVSDLYLIPAYSWVHTSASQLDDTNHTLYIRQPPNDNEAAEAYTIDGSNNQLLVSADYNQLRYPHRGGILSFYGYKNIGVGAANDVDIEIDVYPRWISYRPADTAI